jgi:2-polyprenyl-6-methoxyphenol hydroxylase-like FAD-dependent oxidoreductase
MKLLIIGGGIGGLTTAIALQKKGLTVQVFESATEFKPLGAGLVLAANAMKALQTIGVSEAIQPASKLLTHGMILTDRGKVLSMVDVAAIVKRFGMHNFTIHRADLHQILLSQLQPNTLVYNKKCADITQHSAGVTVTFTDGITATGDYLLAADGVHSVVRQKLIPESTIRHAGYTCWRAVVEADPSQIDLTNFTESWGTKGRFGIAPLTGNRVYWYACLNAPAQSTEMKQKTIDDLRECFKDYHDPIPYLLSITQNNQLIHNDIVDIKPLKQLAFGRILLMGDAGHATTPNMGQGACQAIEDAAVLMNQLGREATPELDFRAFERKRLARTTQVNTASWQIGRLSQMDTPWLASLRNRLMPLIPKSFQQKQLEFLYEVDF